MKKLLILISVILLTNLPSIAQEIKCSILKPPEQTLVGKKEG